jgi:DNA-binding HxlR family transcriptional regulator
VGDRWTLLIMRELTMGNRRFEDIQAQTGMSPHLLSARLKRLEKDGVIERRLYHERPKRFEYYATEKGRDLDSVLITLRAWGLKWGGFLADAEPAARLVHRPSGELVDAEWRIPADGRPFSFDDLDGAISPAWAAEREANQARFRSARKRAKTGT